MFCQKCGVQNPANGKFCRSCGTNLAPVSGDLPEKTLRTRQGFGNIKPIQPLQPIQFRDKKGKPVNWESAITKLFSGLAFLVTAIVLAFTQTGNGWWFWLLFPAFGTIGSGIAQLTQLKKSEKNNVLMSEGGANQPFAPVSNAALPSSQTDYVKTPQKSIYETGELIAPPSVVEGTTRHLEMNREGETMTLPENGKWKTENE